MSRPEQRDARESEGRARWQRPTLTRLGHVKDLVQVSKKSGADVDSDPVGPRKPPGLG